MKKLAIIIPIVFLVACSNKPSNVAKNIENELKTENTIEILEETKFNEESKPVLEKTKNDNDCFTFERPVFTNPTGTKWEITSTTSCTIDLNEYAPWVKKNIEFLVEDNMKSQNLNSMVDLVEYYKNEPIIYDYTIDKICKIQDVNLSNKAAITYLKGFNHGGEIKISNQNLLNSLDYVKAYCLTLKTNKVIFKEDINFEINGISWYVPDNKNFYGSFDTRDYFICDLENKGKAYFCKLSDMPNCGLTRCWAELKNNCCVEIMNVKPLYSVEALALTCPVGYLHRITSVEELQHWAYLYSSIYTNYIDEDKVPNANEKSVAYPYLTNRQVAKNSSNRSTTYAHMDGKYIRSDAYIADKYLPLFKEYFVNYNCIKENNHNHYIDEYISNIQPVDKDYPWEWKESDVMDYDGSIINPGCKILYQQMDVQQISIRFENDKNQDLTLQSLRDLNIQKRQLSIDDFNNYDIISEVVNYVKSKEAYTFESWFNGKQHLIINI